MVSVIEGKIHFRLFWIILDNINMENIAKFKLLRVRGFNFVCLMTPIQIVFGIIKEGY